tara:strand:- start:34854 stop:35210 length:357 start_codon:yes stop_codon:yes gene_type:complete
MLGKLKEVAMGKAMAKLETVLGPEVKNHVDTLKSLKPADVQDDEKFTSVFIKPTVISLKASTGGAITLAEKAGIKVEEKLVKGFLHIRDELIQVEGEKVKLDPDFASKAAPTLMAAFK